jgi:hypothetical protein
VTTQGAQTLGAHGVTLVGLTNVNQRNQTSTADKLTMALLPI